MRVLAVDYGDRRTGLAFSDLGGVLCGEAFTVEEWDPERLAGRIADECRTRGAGRIVLGLPKNMDGTEGPRAEKSRAFAELLRERTGLEVRLWGRAAQQRGGARHPLRQRQAREKTQEKRGRPGRRSHPGELPRLRTHMKSKIPRSL